MNFKNVLKLADISGSSRRKSGVPRRLWASTAHCSNSVISAAVKKPVRFGGRPQAAAVGTPAPATENEEMGTATMDCRPDQGQPPPREN